MSGRILVGTASWTDPSLIESGRFYPPSATDAEARLRHYASVFPLVEVDSSYYGLPSERNAVLWAERTPDDFTFDIKAFSLFTHHPTRPGSLPRDIRERLPLEVQGKANLYHDDVPEPLRETLWERFDAALQPLVQAGKLGVVLFQFPPWFLPRKESLEYLAALPERVPLARAAVEFRNARWLSGEQTEETLSLLAERGLTYVTVDEPQGTPNSAPPLAAVTSEIAVVRFHGRNQAAWAKRGGNVAEKYDWLYSEEELHEWEAPIRGLAAEADTVHVVMNNCREDKAVMNARQIAAMLGAALPEATAPKQLPLMSEDRPAGPGGS